MYRLTVEKLRETNKDGYNSWDTVVQLQSEILDVKVLVEDILGEGTLSEHSPVKPVAGLSYYLDGRNGLSRETPTEPKV